MSKKFNFPRHIRSAKSFFQALFAVPLLVKLTLNSTALSLAHVMIH